VGIAPAYSFRAAHDEPVRLGGPDLFLDDVGSKAVLGDDIARDFFGLSLGSKAEQDQLHLLIDLFLVGVSPLVKSVATRIRSGAARIPL
jgi:hypothetical protein